jgi:ABC-type multidrug transport system ATPase subunit
MRGVSVLHIQNLSFSHPDEPALFIDWSARIGSGVTLVRGDTGSGKSTLLRLLSGASPVKGDVRLAGVGLADDPEAYRREVFFCEPATDVFDQVSANDCTASLTAGDARFDAAEWQGLTEGFALTPHLHKPMYMLSTGSKRKVWLAAALASGRALILLDEPTAALDAASIRCLWAALSKRAEQDGQAIVVASFERIDRVPLAGLIELPPR